MLQVLLLSSFGLIVLSWLLLSFRLNYIQILSLLNAKFQNTKHDNQVKNELLPSEELEKYSSTLSTNEDTENTEEVSEATAVSSSRSLSRQHGSIMLNNGSCHEVWKPGKKLSRSSNSISDRKYSLYSSIRRETGLGKAKPTYDEQLMETRKNQWQKLETEMVNTLDEQQSFVQHSSLRYPVMSVPAPRIRKISNMLSEVTIFEESSTCHDFDSEGAHSDQEVTTV